ncbi:MAG TPA: hypothetical protein VMM60_03865 [Ilumatobacter sp.]|nr:hypothetical protein [Ilumatobacter sp.]
MDPDFAQRRRFLIALAVTLVLVPGAFLLNRGGNETDASTPVTMVGTVPNPAATTTTTVDRERPDVSEGTDPLGTIGVGYLQGSVVPNTADAPTIGIPRPTEVNSGKASFSYDIETATQCITDIAPNGVWVTVTNLDNSRTVQCINTLIMGEQPFDVMLSSQSFVLIADLTDAPVHVEITW